MMDIAKLLLDSRAFVSKVRETKGGRDLTKPLLCPVAGLPHRLAFLVYCGVDVFDSIPLIMAAENGTYLTPTGPLDYSRLDELPCSCDACSKDVRDRRSLLAHNIDSARTELRLIRHSIELGRLRELVEGRIRADPWLVQGLRLMDLECHELQEMHAPVKGSAFHAGSKESLTRPDVIRWQMRIRERYRRPGAATTLLLIPCSAKKPYSLSRSHMRFREAIFASGRANSVHEVVVTSPLGIVPRELELLYPAKDYDIPVTGHWDLDEKRLVEEMVAWLVETQGYDLVISHLGDEREPVNSVLSDFVDTSQGNPGSRESLDRLRDTLSERVPDASYASSSDRKTEDIRSLCRVQFGRAGDALCEGATARGRWPHVKIVRDGVQLGMLTGERGMVSLTIDGARTLAASESYCVDIDDFKPKGNLFAVGVDDVSPEVRIGDDVAVVHNGDVRAVGVARMSAAEMSLAERGEAVHVRHVA
jgi:archaeosine synthase